MGTKIEYLGHSGFRITAPAGAVVMVDPFLRDNPYASLKPEDIEKCDIIAVTHGHGDHLGDTVEIAKNTGATVVAIHEIAQWLASQGVENVIGMNFGGTVEVKGVSFTLLTALHSSGLSAAEFNFDGGNPGSFIIDTGKKIYHAGDTSLFGDMKTVIGDIYRPDVALLPIGDTYTMGAKEAAVAVKWLRAPVIIPIHYKTFPVIAQSAGAFKKELDIVSSELGFDVDLRVMEPGEETEI